MQSLGKIVQRTPAIGVKIWCLYVCFFCHAEAGTLFVQGGITLSRFCVAVYGLILIEFSTFFQKGLLFQMD